MEHIANILKLECHVIEVPIAVTILSYHKVAKEGIVPFLQCILFKCLMSREEWT